jgi:methylthioxylose transferase
VPALICGTALATVAVGLAASSLGVRWGAPAQPLTVVYLPKLSPWALPGLALVGASLALALALLRSRLGVVPFGAALFALTLATRVGLNVVRAGPGALDEVFVVRAAGEGRTEYLPGLAFFEGGVGHFLDRFPDIVAVAPTHVAGHPPGLVVTMHLLGIDTAAGLAAFTIVLGALAAPVLYLLGRRLFGEAEGRVAALLFVFVPTSMLYGATSADALYATLALAATAALLGRRRGMQVLGALLLALASFFSYALLAAGAWAGLVRWLRQGLGSAVRLALLCGAALVGFYLALYLLTGFDLFAAVTATEDRYREGIAHARPYAFYFFGSPAAYVVMLGPVAWFAGRALARREATAVALGIVIAVSMVAGYTKAETERIWLFLVPFACLAAARAVAAKRVPLLLAALTAQAVAFEILLFTKW